MIFLFFFSLVLSDTSLRLNYVIDLQSLMPTLDSCLYNLFHAIFSTITYLSLTFYIFFPHL